MGSKFMHKPRRQCGMTELISNHSDCYTFWSSPRWDKVTREGWEGDSVGPQLSFPSAVARALSKIGTQSGGLSWIAHTAAFPGKDAICPGRSQHGSSKVLETMFHQRAGRLRLERGWR